MTLCPIAIVAGCKKCPAFKVCPLKSVIGDVPKPDQSKPAAQSAAKPAAKPTARSGAKTKAKARKK